MMTRSAFETAAKLRPSPGGGLEARISGRLSVKVTHLTLASKRGHSARPFALIESPKAAAPWQSGPAATGLLHRRPRETATDGCQSAGPVSRWKRAPRRAESARNHPRPAARCANAGALFTIELPFSRGGFVVFVRCRRGAGAVFRGATGPSALKISATAFQAPMGCFYRP